MKFDRTFNVTMCSSDRPAIGGRTHGRRFFPLDESPIDAAELKHRMRGHSILARRIVAVALALAWLFAAARVLERMWETWP